MRQQRYSSICSNLPNVILNLIQDLIISLARRFRTNLSILRLKTEGPEWQIWVYFFVNYTAIEITDRVTDSRSVIDKKDKRDRQYILHENERGMVVWCTKSQYCLSQSQVRILTQVVVVTGSALPPNYRNALRDGRNGLLLPRADNAPVDIRALGTLLILPILLNEYHPDNWEAQLPMIVHLFSFLLRCFWLSRDCSKQRV